MSTTATAARTLPAPIEVGRGRDADQGAERHRQVPTSPHGPLYTDEQRAAALSLLMPSLADAVLGAGWDDVPSPPTPSSPTLEASSLLSPGGCSSSFSSSGPSTPPNGLAGGDALLESAASKGGGAGVGAGAAARELEHLTDALLVRSCRQGWERSFELHSHWPRPRIEAADEVLIRNVAVGLNPVDWKSVSYNFGIADWPWVLGRDVAGIVEQVGAGVEGFQVGDRVWTCADSRDSRAGAYQRFSIAKADTVGKVPDRVRDQEAATIGTGLVTAAVIMYWLFRLPPAASVAAAAPAGPARRSPSSICGKWILIYGGGAVTGIYAAQLAALSGLRVVSVASPSNFDYLQSIGVEACVDRYADPSSVLRRIDEITAGDLAFAIDCVGSKTANICYEALALASRISAVAGERPLPVPREVGELVCLAGNPKPDFVDEFKARQEAVGGQGADVKVHRISFSTTFYGDSNFSRSTLDDIYTLLLSGELQPVCPEIVPDGLAGIRRGLEALRDGTAPRAKKLVVSIADTPSADLTHLGVKTDLGWNGVV